MRKITSNFHSSLQPQKLKQNKVSKKFIQYSKLEGLSNDTNHNTSRLIFYCPKLIQRNWLTEDFDVF